MAPPASSRGQLGSRHVVQSRQPIELSRINAPGDMNRALTPTANINCGYGMPGGLFDVVIGAISTPLDEPTERDRRGDEQRENRDEQHKHHQPNGEGTYELAKHRFSCFGPNWAYGRGSPLSDAPWPSSFECASTWPPIVEALVAKAVIREG